MSFLNNERNQRKGEWVNKARGVETNKRMKEWSNQMDKRIIEQTKQRVSGGTKANDFEWTSKQTHKPWANKRTDKSVNTWTNGKRTKWSQWYVQLDIRFIPDLPEARPTGRVFFVVSLRWDGTITYLNNENLIQEVLKKLLRLVWDATKLLSFV